MQRFKAQERIVDLVEIFPYGLPSTYNWNADGTISYIDATDGVNTWRLTFTYTAGKVTATSGWVLQ